MKKFNLNSRTTIKNDMEKFKKPEMILTLITIAFFIGTFVYFYRKTSALDEETGKLIDLLAATTKKVKETDIYAEHIKQLEISTQQLNTYIVSQNRSIQDCQVYIENLLESVDVLAEALRSVGYDVRLPPIRVQPQPHPQREVYRPPPPPKSWDYGRYPPMDHDDDDVAAAVSTVKSSRK